MDEIERLKAIQDKVWRFRCEIIETSLKDENFKDWIIERLELLEIAVDDQKREVLKDQERMLDEQYEHNQEVA